MEAPEGGFCAVMRMMRFRNLALPRGGGAPAPPEVAAPKFRPAPGLRSDLGRRCARGRRPEGRRRRLLPASHNPARAGGLCVTRLAAGESPEWIARQMGHTTTEMLIRVYSRYVPNLTRRDGSAFERLLITEFDASAETGEEMCHEN